MHDFKADFKAIAFTVYFRASEKGKKTVKIWNYGFNLSLVFR